MKMSLSPGEFKFKETLNPIDIGFTINYIVIIVSSGFQHLEIKQNKVKITQFKYPLDKNLIIKKNR